MKFPIIFGPTAVGKTELAVRLAEYLPIEVISMDSRQIYKYMDVGTGKPSPEVRKLVPHHLIDFLDPSQNYNAYLFRRDAFRLIADIVDRRKIPIIVGGTGLYADALLFGMIEGVPANEALRTALLNLERSFPGILRRILEKVDPDAAMRIHRNDMKRTVRALEVHIMLGRRISDIWSAQKKEAVDSPFYIILIERKRKDLYDRINERTLKMFKEGLVEEVKALLHMGYSPELDALKTIGYKEVLKYLDKELSLEETIRLVQKNTRQYARRQIMWGRRYREALRFNLSETPIERVASEMSKLIKSRLGG
ncbi:MAG: tRNA dimethylallyltransferase [Thermotogota bacterium]|nr:tRNA dimethylallyltransferase [Thermotogota bacterium]HCZ06460.1 tRNA (adenosine(37)-N6)-dimethylallyltransferase MiaA [Thermotogota bacterium]